MRFDALLSLRGKRSHHIGCRLKSPMFFGSHFSHARLS